MTKYNQASCKQCRREGERLMLKGERCLSAKCAMNKRPFPPGVHGKAMKKMTDYAVRLREKQRAKRFYGVSEKQMRNYYEMADSKPGVTGLLMLQYLESRLDNIVYRLGLAVSRKEARQLVKHAHFKVNGKKVDIPSYKVKPADVIAIKEGSLKSFEVALERVKERNYPAWINFNPNSKEGQLIALPQREELDVPVSEQLIVEYYAK